MRSDNVTSFECPTRLDANIAGQCVERIGVSIISIIYREDENEPEARWRTIWTIFVRFDEDLVPYSKILSELSGCGATYRL